MLTLDEHFRRLGTFFELAAPFESWHVRETSKADAMLSLEQVVGISLPPGAMSAKKQHERPSTRGLEATFTRFVLVRPFWQLRTRGPPASKGAAAPAFTSREMRHLNPGNKFV
jgi:hypothetical protein